MTTFVTVAKYVVDVIDSVIIIFVVINETVGSNLARRLGVKLP